MSTNAYLIAGWWNVKIECPEVAEGERLSAIYVERDRTICQYIDKPGRMVKARRKAK